MISLQLLESGSKKTFSRSSGPGGQNVNKTSSKVGLHFSISTSGLLPYQKLRLLQKFSSGFIQVINQETRSQHQNTFLAYEILRKKIEDALKVQKPRKKIVPFFTTKSGKRTKAKKAHLMKYKNRYVD